MKLLKRNLLLGIVATVGFSTQLLAATYTWTGANGQLTNDSGNWSAAPTYTAADSLYFAGYSGSGSRVSQVNASGTIGSLIFGSETGGAGNAVSLIGGTNYPLTIAGQAGSLLGLTGNLASTNVGLLVQAGAGANGIYYASSGTVSLNRTGLGINLTSPSTTFVNNSSSAFYLDARLTGAGALVLQNGSWVINYGSSTTSQSTNFSGGVTIENSTLNLNVTTASGSAGNTYSPLGNGALTLGLANSSNDAVFLFTELSRGGKDTTNRLSVSSGNLINVSDGTGARIIRNGNNETKYLYAAITLNGSSTLTLDNNNIGGATFILNGDTTAIGTSNDLQTGIRGSGNLYLTGGGLFSTAGGLVVSANGVRNSFTGTTTVHSGTLQFTGTGGFQATSRIQVDQAGVLDVSSVTSGTYALGSYSFSGTNYAQTLAGTGKVVGNVLFGDYATLRPGGSDVTGRSALTFTNNLTLGKLTVIDLSNTSYGAVDVGTVGDSNTGLLTYHGELRLVLDSSFSALGDYELFSATTGFTGDLDSVTLYFDTTLLENLVKAGEIWSGVYNNNSYTFNESTGTLEVAAVPEPSSVVLLGLGLLVVVQRFRRSRVA